MLNVQRLRVLREVAARARSPRAADALSYTQSAVSQAVATLEAETGATLHRTRPPRRAPDRGRRRARGPRRRASSPASRRPRPTWPAILGGHGGHLRMASFPTAGATLMPLAIANFRADHPEVELSLAEGEPEEIAPRLRAGSSTSRCCSSSATAARRSVRACVALDLLEDPMHVALPRGHPLADGRALRLEDLRGESWVQTSAASPCARHVVRSCHAAGFEPVVSFESDDYQTVQGLVAAGVGVALIPQLALSSVRDDIVSARCTARPVRRVVAATPRERCAPAAAADAQGARRGRARLPHARAVVGRATARWPRAAAVARSGGRTPPPPRRRSPA